MKIPVIVCTLITITFAGLNQAEELKKEGVRISVARLLTEAQKYDGSTVCIQGELVGDIFRTRGGFWVNLLDKNQCIGLWIPDRLHPSISRLGRYQVRGDIVRVQGIFYRHCQKHHGGTDIHVVSWQTIFPGYEDREEVTGEEFLRVALFGIIGLCTVFLLKIISRRPSGSSHNGENQRAGSGLL